MKLKFFSMGDWGGRGSVALLLTNHAHYTQVQAPEDADLIVFNGGEDISAAIYGEQPIPGYGIPLVPSHRDRKEMAVFDMFKDDPSKMYLGICRGAQMLNCLNGGSLYQHVDMHGRDHYMHVLSSKEIIPITSTHHQMMRPGPDAKIIATASESWTKLADNVYHTLTPSREKLESGEGEDMEIIWYGKHRTLCIQGHPEYVPMSRFATFTIDLIEKYYSENCRCAA